MIIIIYGPQGSGKGTQADIMAAKTGYLHFSMGDALREEIKASTPIGMTVKNIMDRGELVPASITNDLLVKVVNSEEASKGIIIDGYPRNQAQLAFYSKNFKTDCAIELNLSEKESIKRISTRRICPNCGRNYNTIWLKPKTSGKCDICNTDLVQRDDDQPEEVKIRLAIYNKNTLPMKKYYKKLGILHVIDASGSIAEVNSKIMNILNKELFGKGSKVSVCKVSKSKMSKSNASKKRIMPKKSINKKKNG
jgi:adenylate kinase